MRVGSDSLTANASQVYIVETIPLSDKKECIEDGAMQIAGCVAVERIIFIEGKFPLAAFFDQNTYAHDPRTQFLNWAFMDNTAWDMAADSRGFTEGFYSEFRSEKWSLRGAVVTVPSRANGPHFDWNVSKARGHNLEIERRYKIFGKQGVVRAFAFANHTAGQKYVDMIKALPQQSFFNPLSPRNYNWKYGAGVNAEQEITRNLGSFFRFSQNDGKTETWAFAEVDKSISGGVEYKGAPWKRADDRVGIGAAQGEISQSHRQFLAAGGTSFMLGDGGLQYKPERLIEIYYSAKILKSVWFSPDCQYIRNPGYNSVRGPVSVLSLRLHWQR